MAKAKRTKAAPSGTQMERGTKNHNGRVYLSDQRGATTSYVARIWNRDGSGELWHGEAATHDDALAKMRDHAAKLADPVDLHTSMGAFVETVGQKPLPF